MFISPGPMSGRQENWPLSSVEVRLLQSKDLINWANRRCIKVLVVCYVLVLFLAFAPQANADFIGPYDLGNFTLENGDAVGGIANTDGSVLSPDGGLSIILTGGNSGSDFAGFTDLSILAVATGLVHFQYSYSTVDDPFFDQAGYLLGDTFFLLSSFNGDCNGAACPGTVDFSVTAGQRFGFSVRTDDNTFGAGVLEISDFSAPLDPVATPEPNHLLIVAFAAAILARRWNKRQVESR